jgi:predicted enzyme related to lactoylglutathione lyase
VNARVVGIGGIFFKAQDPQRLQAWYREHLGLEIESWGGVAFSGMELSPTGRDASTIWSIMPASTGYFDPSAAPFMINYRVEDLDGLLEGLRAAGCQVDARVEESEFGRFGWVLDPEGNRLELWEPPVRR